MLDIRKLERQFNNQKNRLLKNLSGLEKKKRLQFFSIIRELDFYRKRESILKNIERRTSFHLQQLNRRIAGLRRQDIYDKKRINGLLNELHKLRKELPKLEAGIRKMQPGRLIAKKHERLLLSQLKGISAKIKSVEAQRGRIQHDLDKLVRKEIMLRQGRIYWSKIEKLQKKAVSEGRKKSAKAIKKIRSIRKPGILKKILLWK